MIDPREIRNIVKGDGGRYDVTTSDGATHSLAADQMCELVERWRELERLSQIDLREGMK